MPPGTCQRCGAADVRCKGLCARCYFAARYERPQRGGGVEGRALERAWDAHQLAVALQADVPYPIRNAGRQWVGTSFPTRDLGGQWVARAACAGQRHLPWDGKTVTPR